MNDENGASEPIEKQTVQSIIDAYKIGGMPLVLVIVGFTVAYPGTLLEGVGDYSQDISPTLVFISGVFLMILGALGWLVSIRSKETAITTLLDPFVRSVETAGMVAKSGAEMQVALRDINTEYPKILESLNRGLSQISKT